MDGSTEIALPLIQQEASPHPLHSKSSNHAQPRPQDKQSQALPVASLRLWKGSEERGEVWEEASFEEKKESLAWEGVWGGVWGGAWGEERQGYREVTTETISGH